ncbi:hypothetical protein A2U01_0021754, partial [Trifolium medium]|nr:hypothetical protein [Trifolium medium]
ARFNGVDHDIKLHMKERFRQFVYHDTTSMCQPPDQVKTKGAPKGWPKGLTKRPSYSQNERSTKHSPSLFEYAESRYPDTHVSQSSYARRKSSRVSTSGTSTSDTSCHTETRLAQLGPVASFHAPVY